MSERVDVDFKDLRVVFTGALEAMTRGEAEAQARRFGAIVGSSVSTRTSLLVAGARVGATKIEAARRLGVSVINEAEWLELVSRANTPRDLGG